jgi:predicted phage tail protein
MSARKTAAIALAALVPVWVYALGVSGGVPVAVASSICVLLITGGLYLMFGPHEETPDVTRA